jgi:Cof subfamily protein (haloacid dehalogenase superfamily)
LKYRLIVTDLDDTLLTDDRTISPRSKSAVQRAAALGITVAIATGRMFPSALPYARELGLTGPMLCCQGAQIVDIETGEQISVTAMPLDLAIDVLHFAEDKGLYIQYYTTEEYFFEKTCEESEFYDRTSGVKGVAVGRKLSDVLDFEPIKLLIIADPVIIRTAYDEAAERWSGKLEVAISKSNYLEFTHPDANKGGAMASLAGKMGIPMEQVMAVGDALNDLSMIRQAGLGVAVSNASEQVKLAAGAVTASNELDGVALAIEKYALGE